MHGFTLRESGVTGHAEFDNQAAGCLRAQWVGLSSVPVQILALLVSTSGLGQTYSLLQFAPGG